MAVRRIIFLWFVFLALLVGWVVFAVIWTRGVIEVEEARSWPTVQGTITVQSISKVTNNRKWSTSYTYRPKVEYVYYPTQDGRRRFGTRIHTADEPARSQEWAQERLSAFPVGKSVTVYYNPASPNVALLEPGINSVDWFKACMLVAGTFVVLGVLAHARHLTRLRWGNEEVGEWLVPPPPLRRRYTRCGQLADSLYTGAGFAGGPAIVIGMLDAGSPLWVAGVLALGIGAAVCRHFWTSNG
jgi:hypothetical protein